MHHSSDESHLEEFEKDWEVDSRQPPLFSVTNFVRLFQINRIVKHVQSANNLEIKSTISILCEDIDVSQKQLSTIKKMLSDLLSYGIRRYMHDYYEEIEAPFEIIELIFNKIILEKYSNEYATITKYTSKNNNDNNHKFENNFFSTNVLITYAFQFLGDTNTNSDIINCSLVSSHFLYHAFDPKSIYYANLVKLVGDTNKSFMPYAPRQWQRFTSVCSVKLLMGENLYNISSLLLNQIAILKNIKVLKICLQDIGQLEILSLILQNNWINIKEIMIRGLFDDPRSNTNDEKEWDLWKYRVIRLTNAKKIEISGKMRMVPIKFSNTCESLTLSAGIINEINLSDATIDDQICNYMINKCDCLGIKYLAIESYLLDGIETVLLLDKFVNKFQNLETFKILLNDYDQYDDTTTTTTTAAAITTTEDNGSLQFTKIFIQSMIKLLEKNNANLIIDCRGICAASILDKCAIFIRKNISISIQTFVPPAKKNENDIMRHTTNVRFNRAIGRLIDVVKLHSPDCVVTQF